MVDRAGSSQQSVPLEVTVDSTVTVTADSVSEHSGTDTLKDVTQPTSENGECQKRCAPSYCMFAVEESVAKEAAYSITLLNVDAGDETGRSTSQTPSFEISVPDNIGSVSVMFEGERFTLLITNQKAITILLMFSPSMKSFYWQNPVAFGASELSAISRSCSGGGYLTL